MAGYANPFGPLPKGSTATTSFTQGPRAMDTASPTPGTNEWQQWFLNTNPEAGWVDYLQGLGLYGIDPASKWARNQYGRVYGQYTAQAATDPNLGFWDWVKGANLGLQNQFQQVAPGERGEYNQIQAPRARIMRAY